MYNSKFERKNNNIKKQINSIYPKRHESQRPNHSGPLGHDKACEFWYTCRILLEFQKIQDQCQILLFPVSKELMESTFCLAQCFSRVDYSSVGQSFKPNIQLWISSDSAPHWGSVIFKLMTAYPACRMIYEGKCPQTRKPTPYQSNQEHHNLKKAVQTQLK